MLYCENRLNTYDATSIYGYIYKITLPDGRYYIGQKKGLPENSRRYFGSGTHIKNWFKKYFGFSSENVDLEIINNLVNKEIIDYALDQDELNEEEIEHICYYKNIQEYKGQCLNINQGGQCFYIPTEEDKEIWRKKMQKHFDDPNGYWKNHKWQWENNLPKMWEANRNRIWTKEERERHSKILKGTKVKDTSNMKLAQTGSKNPASKLDENKVKEIRLFIINNNEFKENKRKIIKELSEKYKVSEWTIELIIDYKTWKHVKI